MLTHLLLVFFKVFFLTFLHLYNKGISRVVILFLILFNFQDAVSVALASSFNIISHSKPFVKYFFKFFQKFFLCRSLLRDSFNIISLSFLFVKYFFKFFQKVFRDQLRSLSRQLNYYITFSFLCQAIFKKFFQLVSVFLPEWTPLTLPLLFSLSKVKVIFSSLSPTVTRARQ